MGTEIERKFLVRKGYAPDTPGVHYMQGYLASGRDGATVRVRVAGEKAFLTIKGPPDGISRLEFEYPIPPSEARIMLKLLSRGQLVEKTRHKVVYAAHTWEVDIFHGENEGLVTAEVELSRPDEPVMLPDWVCAEVSEDSRYSNACLARRPYSMWGKEDAP